MLPQTQLTPDLQEFVLIHLLYQSSAGLIEQQGADLCPPRPKTWKIACVPGLLELAAHRSHPCPHLRTDDPRAITCPQCKKTVIYKERMAALGLAPE